MMNTTTQAPDERCTGAARAAEAMIRALGGSAITLLFPVLSTNGQQIPGLGLDSVATEQIEIAPVAMLTLEIDSSVAASRMVENFQRTSTSQIETIFTGDRKSVV